MENIITNEKLTLKLIKDWLIRLDKNEYKILVPNFQRKYVWKEKEIIKLIESVLNNTFVNSFILYKDEFDYWKEFSFMEMKYFKLKLNKSSEKEHIDSRDSYISEEEEEIYGLLDWQQRLTTLHNLFRYWRVFPYKDKKEKSCKWIKLENQDYNFYLNLQVFIDFIKRLNWKQKEDILLEEKDLNYHIWKPESFKNFQDCYFLDIQDKDPEFQFNNFIKNNELNKIFIRTDFLFKLIEEKINKFSYLTDQQKEEDIAWTLLNQISRKINIPMEIIIPSLKSFFLEWEWVFTIPVFIKSYNKKEKIEDKDQLFTDLLTLFKKINIWWKPLDFLEVFKSSCMSIDKNFDYDNFLKNLDIHHNGKYWLFFKDSEKLAKNLIILLFLKTKEKDQIIWNIYQSSSEIYSFLNTARIPIIKQMIENIKEFQKEWNEIVNILRYYFPNFSIDFLDLESTKWRVLFLIHLLLENNTDIEAEEGSLKKVIYSIIFLNWLSDQTFSVKFKEMLLDLNQYYFSLNNFNILQETKKRTKDSISWFDLKIRKSNEIFYKDKDLVKIVRALAYWKQKWWYIGANNKEVNLLNCHVDHFFPISLCKFFNDIIPEEASSFILNQNWNLFMLESWKNIKKNDKLLTLSDIQDNSYKYNDDERKSLLDIMRGVQDMNLYNSLAEKYNKSKKDKDTFFNIFTKKEKEILLKTIKEVIHKRNEWFNSKIWIN